jgi:hypothetical protein
VAKVLYYYGADLIHCNDYLHDDHYVQSISHEQLPLDLDSYTAIYRHFDRSEDSFLPAEGSYRGLDPKAR